MSDSENPELFDRRGNVYLRMQMYNEAVSDFGRAIELGSDVAYIYGQRAFAYQNLGMYRETLKDLDTAIELDPGCEAFKWRTRVYCKLGE